MFRILEIAWLVIGLAGVLLCSYSIITKNFQGAKYFLLFTIVCGVLYSIRKRQRIKYEAANQKEKTTQKNLTK